MWLNLFWGNGDRLMNDKPATKTVNAYWIYTRKLPSATLVPYQEGYAACPEDDIVHAMIVIAESRGKAKYRFIRHINGIGYYYTKVEYMDIKSACILAKDIDYSVGVIDDCPEIPHKHPLWKLVSERFWPDYDPVYVETLMEGE